MNRNSWALSITAGLIWVGTGCDSPGQKEPEFLEPDTTTVQLAEYSVRIEDAVSEAFSSSAAYGELLSVTYHRGLLYAVDAATDPAVHVIDVTDARPMEELGHRGEGPGEFSSAPIPVQSGDSLPGLWFTEISGRLTQLPPAASDIPEGESPSDAVLLKPSGNPFSVARLGSGFVATRTDSTGGNLSQVLSSYDSTGQWLSDLNRLPQLPGSPASDDASSPLASLSVGPWNQNVLCVNREGVIAVVYRYHGRIRLLQPGRGETWDAETPLPFRALTTRLPGTPQPLFIAGAPGVRTAYVGCAATGTTLLALFDGSLRGKDESAAAPSWLHAFDWAGKLTRVVRLDHHARAMTVSPDGAFLYTVAMDTTSGESLIRRTALSRP